MSSATRVIQVADASQVAAAAEEAASLLRRGGLVGFATETVYGIAALATSNCAMDRLREIKDRPTRPFSVHLGRAADARRYVADLPAGARRIMDAAWPGPVTVLTPTAGQFADGRLGRREGLYERLVYGGIIGLRCPDEPTAIAMLNRVGLPVVAPSANLAGQPSPRCAADVLADLDGRIDLLLDCGPTKYGKDSTIVRCDGDDWTVLREGVYSEQVLRDRLAGAKTAAKAIVFLCTGNTCRSPMAAGLARKIIAARLGCKSDELPAHGYEVSSAGLAAANGGPASAKAVAAAGELGADISHHRSRTATKPLIGGADVVLCMTEFQADEAMRLVPEAGSRIRRLDARGDIPDPIGGDVDTYRRTARRIERALVAVLKDYLL
jgi:protein-tyrosine phosphatase